MFPNLVKPEYRIPSTYHYLFSIFGWLCDVRIQGFEGWTRLGLEQFAMCERVHGELNKWEFNTLVKMDSAWMNQMAIEKGKAKS